MSVGLGLGVGMRVRQGRNQINGTDDDSLVNKNKDKVRAIRDARDDVRDQSSISPLINQSISQY